ncbi:MAG: exodeoxyribonuclease VII small subunit [Candidatus Eremiobacteraeota bacterium]|nr:exodeoxyribonuclease VII small subunit [Candidatus Eremiobacteraeota bacterium]
MNEEKANEGTCGKKFEENMARLEEILQIMERGELGLEESIKYFREGSGLYKLCEKKLKSAEGEIVVLMEGLEGDVIQKPIEENLFE